MYLKMSLDEIYAPIRLISCISESSDLGPVLTMPKKQPYDFFFSINGQLVPTRKSTLLRCGSFNVSQLGNQRIVVIDEDINVAMLQNVINLFEGTQLQIRTMTELADCLDVLDFLQARQYIESIEEIVQANFGDYDIFCILGLAYKYGMSVIFDLCLAVLEMNQFEQIKYNKFDFLECDFTLFQIVLRRHHILKIRHQIDGLVADDIEEVIRMYCYRRQFDQQTMQKLLHKYVVNVTKLQKHSLRLDKLAHKNILESANIETDYYDNQLNNEDYREMLKSPSIRFNKYSIEMRQQERMMTEHKLNEFFTGQNAGSELVVNLDTTEKEDRRFSENTDNIAKERERKRKQSNQEIMITEMQEPAVSKLTDILSVYEDALNEHDVKYRRARRNTRSQFFSDLVGRTEVISKAKLLNSSNLNGLNRLFTIFEPNN